MTTAATTTAALALALAPASNLTPWSATPPRSIATLVWTRRGAGTATTINQVNEWDGCHGMCSM